MEGNVERECSALGGLFQQIIFDMKNGTPLWEDLVAKATKLHSCLRATIQAISAYLDAFQKIADAATNTRGATKEIGTALTRICLRHKAVEARMKTFTSAIMDCLVVPLQEKLEDWKKAVINLDKEHAKEYKRARAELKKRSTDTLRLQKKARKGKSGDLQRRVECSLQDVNERRQLLEETEKKAVRDALVEERSRYCLLVAFLKPVVDEEVAMLSELSHLQEVVDQIQKHTADPYALPPASEQVIADIKNSEGHWTFRTPPSSPSSLGSRKSSMCSISSLNSSSSGSSKSHHSPSHHYWHRSLSQRPPPRVASVSSRDSGFTSQDTLFARPRSVAEPQVSNVSENNGAAPGAFPTGNAAGTLPNTTSTWPNLQESLQFERASSAAVTDRPHTISSAYERGHQRPALTVYTFQAPDAAHSQPASPVSSEGVRQQSLDRQQQQPIYARPPIPQRCSSLERPSVPAKVAGMGKVGRVQQLVKTEPPKIILPATQPLVPKADKNPASSEQATPMYVNMHELANMAASKAQEMNFPPPPPEVVNVPPDCQEKTETVERDGGSTSESSLESSSGYGSQIIPVDEAGHAEGFPASRNSLLRRGSVQGGKPPPPIRRTASVSGRALSPVGGSMENLPPPPAFMLAEVAERGTSVAEAVRTLTELRHTPASPVGARRALQQHRQSAPPPGDGGGGLVAALGARIAARGGVAGAPAGFLQALNTKLAQQPPPHRAGRVRQFINSRTVADPALCHESLMDQIKRGTTLRRTAAVNDRSAPKIR